MYEGHTARQQEEGLGFDCAPACGHGGRRPLSHMQFPCLQLWIPHCYFFVSNMTCDARPAPPFVCFRPIVAIGWGGAQQHMWHCMEQPWPFCQVQSCLSA